MYASRNFATKKALKEAVARGERVGYYQPGGYFEANHPNERGEVTLEGPYYPRPHTWYAVATVNDEGVIVKVR